MDLSLINRLASLPDNQTAREELITWMVADPDFAHQLVKLYFAEDNPSVSVECGIVLRIVMGIACPARDALILEVRKRVAHLLDHAESTATFVVTFTRLKGISKRTDVFLDIGNHYAEDPRPICCREALLYLRDVGAKVTPQIKRHLQSPDARTRLAAAELVYSETHDEAAFKVIENEVEIPGSTVRLEACQAYYRVKHKLSKMATELLLSFMEDPNDLRRSVAIYFAIECAHVHPEVMLKLQEIGRKEVQSDVAEAVNSYLLSQGGPP